MIILRHLAMLSVLTGLGYLLVRFGGVPGRYMLAVPAIFIIYLGVVLLVGRRRVKPRS
jgi:hypothetical protein